MKPSVFSPPPAGPPGVAVAVRARRRMRYGAPTAPGDFGIRLALAVAIGLGLAWRVVRYAAGFPLWGDEAFVAINLLTRDLAGLGGRLEFGQVAPPGFLWAEWAVVRALGTSEWALRLLTWLAGMASLLLFARFARRVVGPRAALLAVAIFAASVYPVRHGNEVKPYATDLLAALVLLNLGRGVWERPGSARAWGMLTVSAVVAVWCSYPAPFTIAGLGLALGLRAARERSAGQAARALAFAAAAGASWAALMVGFAGPQAREADWLVETETWRDAFPPLLEPAKIPRWLVEVHTGAMMAYPYGAANFGSLATALLVAAGVAATARRRRGLLLILTAPVPVALMASALRRYPYGTSARITLYLAPAICLLAGAGLAALLGRLRSPDRRAVRVAAALGLIPVGGMACDVLWPYKARDDAEHRRIARSIQARPAEGDRVIVFNGYHADAPPPAIGVLTVWPWAQRLAELRFDLLQAARVPTSWAPDPSRIEPTRGGRTWLVVHRAGWPEFPERKLAAYRAALRARLGPSRRVGRDVLGDGEEVELDVFAGP